MFFYLYLILDIFSRKIVGVAVHENELSSHAADLISKSCSDENVAKNSIVLHSDNDSPMKGCTMLAMLQKLGITPSFSRPSVSNDNPFSESMFKTLKYCPTYPNKPFEDLDSARNWVNDFVNWYNNIHKHSSLKFVTPVQRHSGMSSSILEKRKALYLKASLEKPSRWRSKIRNWDLDEHVYLNPPKQKVS